MFELWYEAPGTTSRSFISSHDEADGVVGAAVAKFGFLELDRVRVIQVTHDGDAPEKYMVIPIKLCAVCETPFLAYGGRLCSRQHSRKQIAEAYGEERYEDI